jgi:cytochrome P450
MSALARPYRASLGQLVTDLRDEVRGSGSLPPGPTGFSLRRTHDFLNDTLPLLLECHQRYGRVFTVRALQRTTVFMLGPEANHYVTVENADNFSWRQGAFGILTHLLGDGLITTDGDYHDRARKIMMPAFHRRRMDAAVEVMVDEARRALDSWTPGEVVDVYEWIRELALRIAMRALLGLDPDERGSGREAAEQFERALAFYGGSTEIWSMPLRGPRTPWARMQAAQRVLDRIIYAQIERRRAERQRDGEGTDVLAMLMEARDEDGEAFSDRELRDHVITLLFGGHDTSSSTLSFLFYELARNPQALAPLLEEQDAVLCGEPPTSEQVLGELPRLDMTMDETLRLYPPVWFGPRRAVDEFEFGGHVIPAGAHVAYCSWASHRLPDVFPDPDVFEPERFMPERRAQLPKGAYVPFGGGSRICVGKRFGQLVVKTVATLALQRFRLEPTPGHAMRTQVVPTLSPKGGLPMVIRAR